MKKTILTLAAIASVAAANAQRMGDVFVYGGVGYNYSKPATTYTQSGGSLTDEIKNQSAFVTPGIGYQFDKHWSAGVNISYTLGKSDSSEAGTGFTTLYSNHKTTDFAVGPFVRYTQHLGEHFFVFAQFDANFRNGNEREETNVSGVITSDEETYNGFGFNVFPAIGINLSRCWSVTGSFGGFNFTHLKYELPGSNIPGISTDQKLDAFGGNFGQQFTLGVQWCFGNHGGMHKGHHGMMDDTRKMDTNDDSSDMDGGSKKKKMRKDDDE